MRTRNVVLIGLAAAVAGGGAVVGALVLTAEDEPSAARTPETTTTTTFVYDPDPAGLVLTEPDSWFISDDGLTVARDEADLEADEASGPRIRALLDGAKEGFEDALASAEPSEISFVPEDGTIDGHDAVTLALVDERDGTRFVRGYILIAPLGRTGALLLLEAPEAEWDQARPLLAGTIGFDS